MTAYDELMAFQRETEALSQVAGRLGWDQETMMPRGAAEQRAEEMAAMESVLHGRRTDPRIADWLAGATPEGEVEAAQLREIRRAYDRAMKVPARLSSEIARVTSRAQGIWAGARAEEDPSAFLPILTVAGDQAVAIANGAVIVETVFGWPGIGRVMIDSIQQRDFAVVQAVIIVVAVTVFLINLAIDLLYTWLDPRVRP